MVNKIIKPLSLTALIFLVALIVWRSYHKTSDQNAKTQSILLEKDKQLIQKSNAPEHELKNALMRLSEQKNPEAERLSFERAQSKDPEVRKNAAQALGFINNAESEKKLVELTVDSDTSVRLSAIGALGYRQTPGRNNILKAIFSKNTSSIEEKLQAVSSLSRSPLIKAEERLEYTEYVTKLADDSSQKKWTKEILQILVNVAPKDPRTLKLINEILLAAADNNKETAPQTAVVAIQALHRSCPDNRLQLLEKILSSSKDVNILRSAFFELNLLNTAETQALAKKVVEKNWLPQPLAMQAKNLLTRFENKNNKQSTFCQAREMRRVPSPRK